jgi:hypothetical protein
MQRIKQAGAFQADNLGNRRVTAGFVAAVVTRGQPSAVIS